MPAIRPLSLEVKEKLQSAVNISGMAQCVEELIMNSLDASATFIEIGVEPSSWKIYVTDDGIGMSLEDMRIVGERHNTSKCHSVADLRNPKTFGYRGQALASIRDICLCFEIESHLRLCPHSHLKTFRKGVLCALETVKTSRQRPGTTITVTDLFHSVPVRKTFASTETEFDMVRGLVESVALIHSTVSFVLVNCETRHRVLETRGRGSTIAVFDRLFGSSRTFGFKPFEFETHSVKFSGFIGTKAASRKSFQFIYVNGRWLPNSRLHKVLHKMLKLSVFLNADQDHSDSSFCSTDNHGVYIINILCVMSGIDVSLLKSKSFLEYGSFQNLVVHLKRGVLEFLSRENLLDSLSMACLLQKEQKYTAEVQSKREEMGKRQGSEGIARVDDEDNDHDISTVNIKNNQQSKLIRRFEWVTRTEPSNSSDKTLNDMSLSNEDHINKHQTLTAGNNSAQLALDRVVTRKNLSEMQEKESFKCNSHLYSESFEYSARDRCTVPECSKSSQSQFQLDQNYNLLYGHLDLKRARYIEENISGVVSPCHITGVSAGLKSDIQQKTEPYSLKKQETLGKFLCHSMMTGSNECSTVDFHSSGNSCQSQKRLFPFDENSCDDRCRFEDNSALVKENFKANFTKRMNIDLTEVSNKISSDMLVACGSYLSDNREPLKGKCESYSTMDSCRNSHHTDDRMISQMPMPYQGAKENLPVDHVVVDTATEAKVEGLQGIRLSSYIVIEHTSISYYHSNNSSSHVINALPPGESMEVYRENNFTQIRAVNSTVERRERRQQLRLNKHSDLQLDSLNFGRHVGFSDWKQNRKTLPDIIDLRRSGKELNLLDSLQLTNDSISNLKVICQVERKFIAGWIKKCTESELLVFIDQHAADERVRLEQLSKEAVVMDSRGTSRVSHSVVRPMLMLSLDLDFIPVMDRFQEFFATIGLTYSIDRQHMGRIWLKNVPSCFIVHSAPSSTATRNCIKYLVQKLIHELIQDMKETNFVQPSTAVLPKVLHNVLCSQACHGAIKFGDALGKDKCETLVQRLSLCRLPFQCAHGRPTMIPIADLAQIRKNFRYKKPTAPRLWKLKM